MNILQIDPTKSYLIMFNANITQMTVNKVIEAFTAANVRIMVLAIPNIEGIEIIELPN